MIALVFRNFLTSLIASNVLSSSVTSRYVTVDLLVLDNLHYVVCVYSHSIHLFDKPE